MKKARGIVLVSIMFLAVVVAMFVSSAISLTPSSLARGRNLSRHQSAQRAVQSGVDYALSRVRATHGGLWRAQEPRIVDVPGLRVEEAQGQVVGWVQDGSQWARFRINFNMQDGTGGMDGLPNANVPMEIAVGLSVNNLPGNTDHPVYPLTSHGIDLEKPRFQLSPHSLLLRVEGSCGPTFEQNGQPVNFSSPPSTVVAESILGVTSHAGGAFDSVASAAADLLFTVSSNEKVLFNSNGAGGARLRTKTGISVVDEAGAGATLDSPQGEIRTSSNGNQVGSTLVSTQITRQQENSGDSFYRISKDSVPQLDPEATSLPGGVFEIDLVAGSPVVKHYELSYSEYKARRLAGTLSGGSNYAFPPDIETKVDAEGKVQVQFTKDTTVNDNSAVKDLAIVPAKGAFQEGEKPANTLSAPVGSYLVSLANHIHTSITTTSGGAVNHPLPFSTNPGFSNLLVAAGGPQGTISLPSGLEFDYQNSGTTLQNLRNWSQAWDNLGGTSPYGNGQYQLGAMELAQYFWTRASGNPAVVQALHSYLGSPPPGGFGTGAAPDPMKASLETPGLGIDDLKILLKPNPMGKFDNVSGTHGILSESLTIATPGNLVLAGRINGQGSALIADGDISLLGNGVDLKAAQSANKISLYSAKNILIDGFAFNDSASHYNDVNLEGVVYSWGGVEVNVGKLASSQPWGAFRLRGAMVAYGGNPETQSGSSQDSQIKVVARSSQLTFDPAFLLNLEDSPVHPDSSFVCRAYQQR